MSGERVAIGSGCRVDRLNCWGGRCDESELPVNELESEKVAGNWVIVNPCWWIKMPANRPR